MKMRHADPSRRLPMYLQAYTVENAVWQLKLLVAYFVALNVYEYVQERREMNARIRELHTED